MDEVEGHEIDPEIQAVMGISSFGGKPAKRRRINTQQTADIFNKIANVGSVQLADDKERARAQAAAEYSRVDFSAKEKAASTTPESLADAKASPSPAVAMSSTSKLQRPGTGLADFLARGKNIIVPTTSAPADSAPQNRSRQPGSGGPRGDYPARHTPTESGNLTGKLLEDLTSDDLRRLRMGVKDESGDVAFFLPSFVEDPWKGL